MSHGFNGKILHVDLTNRTWEIEEPSEVWYRTYWGGGCLASYYLLKELKPGTDPLSPENVLVFAFSVITGAPLSGFSRYTVAAKSPQTGAFGESEAGGYLGPELKFAGFDAIVFRGRSDKPVYLWIHNGQVEIRDAMAIWGLENGQARDKILEEVGQPKARIACIGPAGERLILFANVINELAHANGRTGMGAVIGSKNLKAIVVRGEHSNLTFTDPDKVKELVKWHNKRIGKHGPNVNMGKHGTPMLVAILNAGGILPTRNFQSGVFEGADKISAHAMEETILQGRGTCYRCAVECPKGIKLTDIMYACKRMAIMEGVYPRHFPIPVLTNEFFKTVRERGRNTESWLIVRLFLRADPRQLLKQAGLGLRLFLRGRMSPRLESVKHRDEIRNLLRVFDTEKEYIKVKRKRPMPKQGECGCGYGYL